MAMLPRLLPSVLLLALGGALLPPAALSAAARAAHSVPPAAAAAAAAGSGNRSDDAAARRRLPSSWAAVRAEIDGFALLASCHVIVGDEGGELFSHQKGAAGLDTEMQLYSATKWVSGVAIMSLVAEGSLRLDDLASDHLDYWTTDPGESWRAAATPVDSPILQL